MKLSFFVDFNYLSQLISKVYSLYSTIVHDDDHNGYETDLSELNPVTIDIVSIKKNNQIDMLLFSPDLKINQRKQIWIKFLSLFERAQHTS